MITVEKCRVIYQGYSGHPVELGASQPRQWTHSTVMVGAGHGTTMVTDTEQLIWVIINLIWYLVMVLLGNNKGLSVYLGHTAELQVSMDQFLPLMDV